MTQVETNTNGPAGRTSRRRLSAACIASGLWLATAATAQEGILARRLEERLHDPALARNPGTSRLVSPGADGRLTYRRDSDGNRICDFSFAGYRGGGVAIPDIPVARALEPQPGDDTARIEAALAEIGALPRRENGFRGALLLRSGMYTVSDTIDIRHDGIVVRGEGAGFGGTWIYHRRMDPIPDPTPARYIHWPQPEKGMVPTFLTHGGKMETRKVADIVDPLVPAGADQLHLNDTAGLAPGDEIVVLCRQTQQWIDALGLDEHWKPEQFELRCPRVVKEVDPDENRIVLNVPVSTRIDRRNGYAHGTVHAVTADRRLRHVGVEDILLLSGYDLGSKDEHGYFIDEHHPNYAFRFYNLRDGWVRRCVGFFYSCGLVSTGGSQHLTIEDCAMLDGVSTDTPRHHTGTRKYYFNAQGDLLLFQRCYSRYARHAFIGNGPRDGAVFLDCFSEHDHLKSEWHQHWGHGHLFDNIACDAQIGMAGNRSSHGQKAAFAVAWNNLIHNRRTYEPDLYVNDMDGLFRNYAIGNVLRGSQDVSVDGIGTPGHLESRNRFVAPRSLYLAQLRDRLGADAVRAIATKPQIDGPRGAVWRDLVAAFARLPEWPNPDDAPWPGFETWMPTFNRPAALQTAQTHTQGRTAMSDTTEPAPQPPPGAATAGLTRLAFREEFDDASGIDLDDTREPGFTFYPKLVWGQYVVPREHIRIENGVLHLTNPENHAQGDLFSVVSTGKPGEWTGFAVGREHGGGYFEASIAFDPGASPGKGEGFPAFWTMSAEHFFGNLLPKPYSFLEIDFMEYNPMWFEDDTDYLHANHVWTFFPDGKRQRDTFPKPYSEQVIDTPDGIDYTQFHTFGCLWIPGPDGRIDTYLDNRLMRSVSFRDYPDARGGDDHHFPVFLGCGNWPMKVDWVRVWTK